MGYEFSFVSHRLSFGGSLLGALDSPEGVGGGGGGSFSSWRLASTASLHVHFGGLLDLVHVEVAVGR